jgi:outer membrane receptor protein involved in Fe transport
VQTGPFNALRGIPSPSIVPTVDSKENAFTYLLTPRFKFSPDLMLYARMASGYRPGGPNVIGTALGLPTEYKSDKTQNYEIGLKGDLLDNAINFDASVYYIDWKNIQLNLIDQGSGIAYFDNATRAKSEGVELSVESRLQSGLMMAAWVAYNNATLTEAFPTSSQTYGADGDRLPYSSQFSGNLSLDQDFQLGGNLIAIVGGSLSYVGERFSYFTATPIRQRLPAYAQTDLHGGVRYEDWAVNLSVNNVTDRRGVLTGGLGSINELSFNYIQPRTIGLSLSKTF